MGGDFVRSLCKIPDKLFHYADLKQANYDIYLLCIVDAKSNTNTHTMLYE